MTSRLQETLKSVPPCTLFFTSLCIVIYVIQLFFGGVEACAINAYYVINKLQIYRIFSSTFTHLSLLHIVFNLLSFYSINTFLERKNGSVFSLYAILLFTVLNGLLYVGIYKLLAYLINGSYDFVSAAGFSGVIFSLLTWESYVIEVDTIPIFGLFKVPRKWYAVVYLILMSVLMPGVSFIGHLCGVITGFFFATGYLNWLIPMHFLIRVEKSFVGSWMKRSDAFIYMPEVHQALGSCLSFGTMLSQAWDGVRTLGEALVFGVMSILKFIFDSIFPPVVQENQPTPNPASGRSSDVEANTTTTLSAEDQRQLRLQALASRGVQL